MRHARAGLLAALAAAALAAAGCGPESTEPATDDAEQATLGARTGKLDCADWRRGSEAERRGSVAQLTLVAEGNANPDDEGPNRVLTEDEAYDVFAGWCENGFARGFLLYDLYNRAAVFRPGLDADARP